MGKTWPTPIDPHCFLWAKFYVRQAQIPWYDRNSPVGTAGKIRTYPASNGYRATTIYRDYDGRNRQIERHGKTKNAAQRALAEAK